ncbi:MAG: 6-bladed beta-propeller [Balneolaceae bacterium]|nr:6-bladed beta-propeller [Balneolaceae bacterium]
MRIIFFVFALFLLMQCKFEKNKSNILSNKVELIHENDVQLKTSSILFGRFRQEFTNSSDGQYWAFHDFTKQQILVFKSNGDFVTTIGSKGRGPSEFENVFGFTFDEENTIWAFDEKLDLFKNFNLSDSLINTYHGIYENGFLQSHPQLFVNKGKIYIPITEVKFNTMDYTKIWQSALMAVYDTNGSFLNMHGRFGPPAENPDTYNVRAMLDFDFHNNTVLSAYTTSYLLGEFDLESNQNKFFGVEPPNFKTATEKTTVDDSFSEILEKGLSRSAPMSAYITKDYYIFYYQNLSQSWYDTRSPNNKSHYLVLYNRSTKEFIKELKLPYALGNITRENDIHLIKSFDPDNFMIAEYKLKISYK